MEKLRLFSPLSAFKSVLKNKKGNLDNLTGVISTLVVVAILLGVVFLVLSSFIDQILALNTAGGNESADAVNDTLQALKQIPTWLPLVVILSIVGIILAIVFTVLPRSGGGSSI